MTHSQWKILSSSDKFRFTFQWGQSDSYVYGLEEEVVTGEQASLS